MTPHELNLHIAAYNEREQAAFKSGVTLAYLTAGWQRAMRLPDLNEVLKEDKPKREQSVTDMLAEVKKLNALMGGTSG